MKIVLNGQLLEVFGAFPRGPAGPDGNPIGTVISYMGLTAPTDYLICDGATYNITDYPHLADVFRKQFGNAGYFGGNGTTTFAVPDMRNLFLRGYHGSATALSGNVGVKQEATQHPNTQVVIQKDGGCALFAVPNQKLTSYTDTIKLANADSTSQFTKTAYFESDDANATEKSCATYTSRPANMAVLYCIKAVYKEGLDIEVIMELVNEAIDAKIGNEEVV